MRKILDPLFLSLIGLIKPKQSQATVSLFDKEQLMIITFSVKLIKNLSPVTAIPLKWMG
jgi:hypothetical protein